MSVLDQEILDITLREIVVSGPYDVSGKPQDILRVVFLLPYGHEFSLLCMGPLALYDLVNRRADVPAVAERAVVYDCLVTQGNRYVLPEGTDFRSIENPAPIRAADVLGVSITNSGDLPTFFKLLDVAGVPRRSEDRVFGVHPLVIGGNGGFANPEVLGDYLDAVALGEGEESMLRLIDIVHAAKRDGTSKADVLEQIAQVPGMYVPAMYTYGLADGGGITGVTPRSITVPNKVHPQYLEVDDLHDAHFVAPIIDAKRGMIVPTLGCRWDCHFCTLGVPPFRQAPFELLMSYVDRLEQHKVPQLIISSPTFTQYGKRYRLLDRLREYAERSEDGVTTIIGSVRADELSTRYLSAVSELGDFGHLFSELKLANARGIVTIAPEFASPDLVAAFNKTMTKDRVNRSLEMLRENEEFAHIMLYFIVGAPGETREDREAIADYVVDVFQRFDRADGTVIVKLQQFMPKPNTVSQRLPMCDPELVDAHIDDIRQRLLELVGSEAYESNFRVLWGESSRLLLESVCLRGDRRIGRILERLLDAGVEFGSISGEQLREALEAEGLNHAYYLGALDVGTPVPWEVVNTVDPAAEVALIETLASRADHHAGRDAVA
ncbi:radical SAM protein [Streptomyces tendae]|uniref:B12-binding domain-containing radical SAM protein n=1 Tax=Streptomyces tendae TaxID=1932 RepID=UPI0033CD91BD